MSNDPVPPQPAATIIVKSTGHGIQPMGECHIFLGRLEILYFWILLSIFNLVQLPVIGGYNVLYQMSIECLSTNVLVRLPCPDQAVSSEEKTIVEAATSACIRKHTYIPMSMIFSHGIDPELGPFMIIQDLGSRRGLGQALAAPRQDSSETPVSLGRHAKSR